jgi:hypothetical protein
MLTEPRTPFNPNFDIAPWVPTSAGTNGRGREAQPQTPFIPAEAGIQSFRGKHG